jgi:cytochrome c oxidase assembly factor 6
MGLFSTSKPTPLQPTPSSDGGFIAPDRDARAACWEGRDAFFKCLDSHGIIDSVREDAKSRKACPEELRAFEKDCAGSWVTYFKKRRVMEHQRDATLKKLAAEGAVNVDQK